MIFFNSFIFMQEKFNICKHQRLKRICWHAIFVFTDGGAIPISSPAEEPKRRRRWMKGENRRRIAASPAATVLDVRAKTRRLSQKNYLLRSA